MMNAIRKSGLLLHPTSLPSRWGIGDLGLTAYEFVDFLAASGQQLWQVMPLGPTGYGDSPYQGFSAFAGNPLLISFDILLSEGLLAEHDLADTPFFNDQMVDYGAVIPFKLGILRRSFEHFKQTAAPAQRDEFAHYRETQRVWLADYAMFAALKDAHGGANWNDWEATIARREPAAVSVWASRLSTETEFHAYMQWQFSRQWAALKQYANARNIAIIGDIPIFVAYDSADVWANREIFALDEAGQPIVVAGVPPDYFSVTGQLWGNPLYRWDVLAQTGYRWWVERFRAALALVDIVRLDHFRGFAAYWAVPASDATAVNGTWVDGPGAALFQAASAALGKLPVIAEDLGLITPDVEELRDQFGFPGMKVLQFAFGGGPTEPYQPHNYNQRSVVYTGTHDNDTTTGWWRTAAEHERRNVQIYLGRDGSDVSWDFIRLALASVADTTIIPLQDVFALDSSARMNTPGRAAGNWSWRYLSHMIQGHVVERLRTLTYIYGRTPTVKTAEDRE
jgi:4-alpha-glucanotransferase